MPPNPISSGLTSSEAERRLRLGRNVLPVPPAPPAWRLLAAQMTHFFAAMLWIAGILAFVAGMPQLGVAIFVIVVINAVFAFVQEHRAERAAERLRDLLPRWVTVLRDGSPREVDAAELVVDDVVLLAAGDRVSADLQLLEARGLTIDASTLTGESEPVRLGGGETAFAGTFVVEGEARGVVTATGGATRLAGIARLTRAGHRPASPLARELSRVVRIIAMIAIGVGVAFFGIAVSLGLPPADGFLFAIGVTVALVPEGLLPTVTLSLAHGAQRMAGRNALVRRLESVETLGSTTVICTDKTGTLTRNQMAVVEVWTPTASAVFEPSGYDPTRTIASRHESIVRLARAAARCSDGRVIQRDGSWMARGDPMEAALFVLACRLGLDVDAESAQSPASLRFPFDPRRRRMSIVADGRLWLKGAPDAVLPLCAGVENAAETLAHMTSRGLRVLAIAERSSSELGERSSVEDAERDLELLGLVALEDPPRAGAAAALAACRRAGIRVIMVTGDHPATATAIGREIGLLLPESRVIEGRELPADEVALGELLDLDGTVVSRVAPEDKLRIARALRTRGHVVAMTGDGVNDGPALQEADIGVAMGRSGTDVAREASDLVLLDDDFATIVAAIEQGRATYLNIRRFLTYHMTDNVAELTPFAVWALSGGSIPLALGVLQVLLLDVGTDQLPALGLGTEPPSTGVLDQPPIRGHLLDGELLRRVFLVLGPAEAVVEMAAFAAVLMAGGWWFGRSLDPSLLLTASGAAFAAVVVGQAAAAYACRSTTRWPGALGWTTNRLLLLGVVFEIVLLGLLLYVEPVAAVVGHSAPPLLGWAIALLAAPAVLTADWLHKRARGGPSHRAGGG